MQDELEDNQEDYHSLTHEYWCDLLSTIEFKDNRKRAATQIENISSDRYASRPYNYVSVRIPSNKNSRTGVLRKKTLPNNKAPTRHGNQRRCVLWKKSGMLEQKYILRSSEDWFGKRSGQHTIKYGVGVPMGGRAKSLKQYKLSNNKWKKELKALNNQNKMICSIFKKTGSRCEIKNIKKIKAKASKKLRSDISDSSSDELYYDYLLF